MPAQLVQMFVLGFLGFGACLFFGFRIKHQSRWMLLAFGGIGLLAFAYFLWVALNGGVREV